MSVRVSPSPSLLFSVPPPHKRPPPAAPGLDWKARALPLPPPPPERGGVGAQRSGQPLSREDEPGAGEARVRLAGSAGKVGRKGGRD